MTDREMLEQVYEVIKIGAAKAGPIAWMRRAEHIEKADWHDSHGAMITVKFTNGQELAIEQARP